MSKFIKLHAFNMCNLFYVNYTSIKLFKNQLQPVNWETSTCATQSEYSTYLKFTFLFVNDNNNKILCILNLL